MSTERNDLNELEARLASLAPAASRASRDRAMFLAGRASAEAETARGRGVRVWLWPASTAAMALVALLLVALLVQQRQFHPPMAAGPHVPAAPRPSHDDSHLAPAVESDVDSTAVADNGGPRWSNPIYLRNRERVLAEGVDALPPNRTSQAGPALEPWTPRSYPLVSELLEG
jgi:hypothetical protein